MPYVKIKIEVEYFVASTDDVQDAVEVGVEELYNECAEWSKGNMVPNIDVEVVEEAEAMANLLLNYTRWEA